MATKKPTIGKNPLDANDPLSFIPTTTEVETSPAPVARPTKQISVRLPLPLYRRLKLAVASTDESQQDYIARILDEHLRIQKA
ncbi:MAG TPA: hypothetical protein VGB53_13560 [Rubricoccaceae bacterium]|jgi:hypothetical protein